MALALCLTLLPTAALAEETAENVAEVTIDSTPTQYTDIEKAFTAAQGAESATVKLLKDVTIPTNADGHSFGIELKGGNITLDLNGCTIQTTGGASGFVQRDAVFYIEGGESSHSSLTVQNKSTNGGKIVQPNGGQAIHVGGALTVESGVAIEVTSTDESGSNTDYIRDKNCAVFLTGGGTANILGGTLTGKQGIYVKNGTLNVSGGTIRGNGSYALWVVDGSAALSGGSYTTGVENGCSIWNAVGTAGNLLARGYRFESGGSESKYSGDTHGVVGDTAVAKRPANEFAYMGADGTVQTKANCTELTADGFTGAQADTTTWFAANTDITADDPLQVRGTVNLILCDGVTVTLNKGISLSGSEDQPATLNIYAQSGGTGKLICDGASDSANAGIYISTGMACTTALNIYGGNITATGSLQTGMSADACGAGIGTSANDSNESTMAVSIFGGTVTAKSGGEGAHAIGQGTNARGTVNVTIAPGMKRVKTDDLNTACDPGNTNGTSVTVTKCENHVWEYTYTEDTHTKTCTLCHTVGESEAHSPAAYVSVNGSQHNVFCVCGKEMGAEDHAVQYTPNPDGLTHKTSCKHCGWTSDDEKHTFGENGACVCGIRKSAEYNGTVYASLQAAVNAAAAKDGGTVTLQMDVGERITVNDGMNVTIDLNNNGWTTDGNIAYATLVVTGGSVTVQNGELTSGTSSNAYTAVEVEGGKLTVGENMTIQGGSMDAGRQFPAIEVKGGELVLSVGAKLDGGLKVPKDKHLSDYLPEGTAFGLCSYDKATGTWTEDKGLFADAYTTNAYNVPDMALVVVEHTQHNFVRNEVGEYVCICGYTCPHNDFMDGKCTICGNGCAHTNVDENGVCENCKTQMVAKVEVGGTTTYTTDLGTTLYKAADSTKITLLANAAVGTVILKDKTVTLDLNGKTVKNSGRGSAPIQIVSSNSPAKLIITGSGSFISSDQPFVVANGTLDLSGWTGDNSFIYWVTISGASSRFISPTGAGKIDRLAFTKGAGTASLNGGRYDEIAYVSDNTIKLGDLLAEGYAFRQNGTFLEYASKLESNGTVKKVEVVKCPHPDAKDGKCLYCGKDGILARVGDTTYGSVSDAVAAWRANGGTLKLYTDGGDPDIDFSSATGQSFTIDLNGCKFNDGAAITLSGGKSLTIMDSKETTSSQGAFGPLVADNGTLTLESGYLQKLTVPSDSLATILLKGGKVSALACPVPVFNLLGNGYCLMDGNIPVDPTTILDSGTGTYTIKNPQPLITADKKNGSSSKGERKIPFTLSLKANDSKVGRMQFKWYFIKEDGTTALLAESGDVTATTNDVFTYDATTQSKVAAGWDDTDLKVRDKPYDVICVVTGKDSNGAYLWQTPLRGYKLTIAPTDLSELMNQGKLTFTQVEDTPSFGEPFKGNIKDGKGTFVFEPYGGDVNNASTLTYCFEVSLDGKKLIEGTDYTIVDKSNEAKYAGAHTLTIQGMGDYKGTATHTWRIEPYKLTRENYNPPNITKVYDGTTGFDFSKDGNWGSFKENVANRPNDAGTGKNPALGADGNAISIYLKPEDLKASAVTLDSPDVGDRTASYTITLKAREGQSEPNFAFEDDGSPTRQVTAPAYITKAFLSSSPEAGELNVANDHAGVYTLDLSALLPKLEAPREYGAVTYGAPTVNLSSGYYAVDTARIENGKLILPIQAVETKETGSIGSVEVKVSTTNYHDFTLTINVNATNKIVPTGTPTLSKNTLAWGEKLNTIALSGTMTDPTDSTKTVKGKFEWVAPGAAKEKIGEYEAAWKFTPDEDAVYTEAAGTVTITVTKATPKGAPKYTAINVSGKTLKDANLTVGTIQPEGTIQWELVDTTVVTANTAYKWVFTPDDKEHYDELTGFITPYSVSSNTGGSSSGGGSSSDRDSYDSNPVIKTETKNNSDGSTTKTETRRDGSVTQTTTGKDGGVSKTETKKDGSSVTENKAADGSTGTVKTDKNGQTEAKTALSNKAIEDAKKSGEAVKAPVEVEASRNSSTAPTVKVELPKGAGETKVEIPVSNATPGTVAVLVHPDGTEEIVKNSLPTEDGIQLTVNGGATVKIVDNAKNFIDTQNHWAKDAIDFVSARELVNGMNDSIYAPNNSTTRAQLWTILARQNDADLNGGSVWYEKAQLWSKDKGISDGTNPNGSINRAQMVTMLWRAMGQPAAASGASFADVPADSYYAQAVAWAVENGITTGVGGGRFDPTATCTRAQIAAFLARSMK